MRSQHHFASRNALTLAEILVSIAICIILAALLVPSMCDHIGSRPGALTSKAGTTARHVASAVRAYQMDYGEFPQIGKPRNADEQFIFVGPTIAGAEIGNESLFDVLRAIDRGVNSGHRLNPRRVKYFEDGRAADPKNPREGFTDGPEFVGVPQGRFMDPWGEQYCIVFETDNDGVLNLHPIYKDATRIAQPVVAFALGKDGIPGTRDHPNIVNLPANLVGSDQVSWM